MLVQCGGAVVRNTLLSGLFFTADAFFDTGFLAAGLIAVVFTAGFFAAGFFALGVFSIFFCKYAHVSQSTDV